MGTVDKALSLLTRFTSATPEWGVSELARAEGLDKATALRALQALARHQMVEQDTQSKRYRLGCAVLGLAAVREASLPLATVLRAELDRLTAETGETSHATIGGVRHMTTVAVAEPPRPMRVHVDPAEPLPFHATASGIAWLAFADPAVRAEIVTGVELGRHTPHTDTSRDGFLARIDLARQNGYAVADKSFEDETVGLAVPYFDRLEFARGAIAIAFPAMRQTAEDRERLTGLLFRASLSATEQMGGQPPRSFIAIAEAGFGAWATQANDGRTGRHDQARQ